MSIIQYESSNAVKINPFESATIPFLVEIPELYEDQLIPVIIEVTNGDQIT